MNINLRIHRAQMSPEKYLVTPLKDNKNRQHDAVKEDDAVIFLERKAGTHWPG